MANVQKCWFGSEAACEQLANIIARALDYPKKCTLAGATGPSVQPATWNGFRNVPVGWSKRPTTTWYLNSGACLLPIPDAMAATLAAAPAQARLTPQDRAILNAALAAVANADLASAAYLPRCSGGRDRVVSNVSLGKIRWTAFHSNHTTAVTFGVGAPQYTTYKGRRPSTFTSSFDQIGPGVNVQAMTDQDLLDEAGSCDFWFYCLYPPASAYNTDPANQPPQSDINQVYDAHIASPNASLVKHAPIIFPIWMSQDTLQPDWGNPGWGTWTKLAAFITDLAARLNDPNVMKINGRPVLGLFGGVVSAPNDTAWATAWTAIKAGIPAFYLIAADGNQTAATTYGDSGFRGKTNYGPANSGLATLGNPQAAWTAQELLDRASWNTSGGGTGLSLSLTPVLDRRPRAPTTGYVDPPTLRQWCEIVDGANGAYQNSIGKAEVAVIYARDEVDEGGAGTAKGQRGSMYDDCLRWMRGTATPPSSYDYDVDAHEKTTTLTGTWTYVQGIDDAYNNDEMTSVTAGDKAEFSEYRCTKMRLKTTVGPDRGIAAISIDGVSQGNVDLYAATQQAGQVVWTSADLAMGLHTITVTVTGTKNASSSSVLIGVDAWRVTVVP